MGLKAGMLTFFHVEHPMSEFIISLMAVLVVPPAWSATSRLTSSDLRLLSLTKETNLTIIDASTLQRLR